MPILEHTFGIVHSIEEVAPGIYFFQLVNTDVNRQDN